MSGKPEVEGCHWPRFVRPLSGHGCPTRGTAWSRINPPTAVARLECGTVGTNSLREVRLGLGQGTVQLYPFRSDSAVISCFQLRSMEPETKRALSTIHSSMNIFLEINRLPPEVLARFHPSSQTTRTSFSPPMYAVTGAMQPSPPLRPGHPWTRKRCTKTRRRIHRSLWWNTARRTKLQLGVR